MVSWTADGLVTGYNPTTRRLDPNLYHLASPGSVDLNGATRFQYALPPDVENYLTIKIPINFTEADRLNLTDFYPVFCAAVYVVSSSAFAPGVVPTPAQIVASSQVTTIRGDFYTQDAINVTFTVKVGMLNRPNTKYWVLATPTRVQDIYAAASVTNDLPYGNVGRAVSIWTNRTPNAPTITSPTTGASVAAGGVINFAYTTNDPDKTTPVDAGKRNLDLAGVQVQYAPVPTPANPVPEWRDLPFQPVIDVPNSTAWFIRGSADSREIYGFGALVENLGLPIMCAGTPPSEHGFLSGGSWQLRCRVFDYGHPYPEFFGGLGSAFMGTVVEGLVPSTYPAANTSPWSEPVTVAVPVRLPPPIPVTPIQNRAVPEDQAVRIGWTYRNTANPPYPQTKRRVQIREAGAVDWTTVFAGYSSLNYVDLPPTFVAPVAPPQQYLPDPGFESGTAGGWSTYPGFGSGSPTNTSAAASPTGSHSGSRYLSASYGSVVSGIANASFYKEISVGDLNPLHSSFTFDSWIGVDPQTYSINVQALFLDPSGDGYLLPGGGVDPQYYQYISLNQPVGGWASQWLHVTLDPIDRPVDASKIALFVSFLSESNTGKGRLDDVSLIGVNQNATESFTLEVSRNYEWRAQTGDSTGEWSEYSQSASFWVVPGLGSGPVRPLPAETIDGATLGIGTHRAFVYRRGGKVRVGEIKGISYLDWGRVRDDISTSKIVVSDWDIDCGNLLAKLQTWAYEIVIFRNNGYSNDRVWEGPISLLTYETDKVTIQAKDVMVYSYRRIIKQAMKGGLTDTVVTRAAQVLQNVLAPDDPNLLSYLTPLLRDDDRSVNNRSIPAYARTAFEEIDDMASNAGLDYTAVGRAILLWGTRHRIGTLPKFKDADLGASPIVSEYGMSMANRYVVSDGNGVWGEATRLDVSGNDPIYGLVEMLSSTWADDSDAESGTYTGTSAATVEKFAGYAETSIADRYRPGAPVVVRIPDNTSLNPGAVISIQQLVPGVIIPLESTSTLRTVTANQKLDSMRVIEEGGKETVSITLSPFNRDDTDTEVGEAE